MNAILALEDGTFFRGVSAGAPGETSGEVVFNTSMTGYQEVLTDPSYAGQIVTMTSPQIGNYGITAADYESGAPRVAGFVVRDLSPIASNWRAQTTLRGYRYPGPDAQAPIHRRDARCHCHRRSVGSRRADCESTRDSAHGRC
jgi:carbamoyl-phosphate synthase small subunit